MQKKFIWSIPSWDRANISPMNRVSTPIFDHGAIQKVRTLNFGHFWTPPRSSSLYAFMRFNKTSPPFILRTVLHYYTCFYIKKCEDLYLFYFEIWRHYERKFAENLIFQKGKKNSVGMCRTVKKRLFEVIR